MGKACVFIYTWLLGNFFGGITVGGSLLFLAYELHTSNRLARAEAQRDIRAAWQETLFKMAKHSVPLIVISSTIK